MNHPSTLLPRLLGLLLAALLLLAGHLSQAHPMPTSLVQLDLQVRLNSGTSGAYAIRNLLGQLLASGIFSNGVAAVPTAGMAPGVTCLPSKLPARPLPPAAS